MYTGVYQLKDPMGGVKKDLVHRDRMKRAVVDMNNPPTTFWSADVLDI